MAGLVTFGICCFNAHGTIERSIRAAQAQDWPDLEIVVVDDASSDDSPQIVERLAAEDSRIRLIRRPHNGGVAASRNTIIREARGDTIAFQDDDDESTPDRISRQVARLADTGPIAACFTSRNVVRPGGAPTYSRAIGIPHPVRGDVVALHLLCGDPLDGHGRAGAGTMMASAETFRAVGPFDESFRRMEESDWLIRMVLAGGEAIGCIEPLLTQHITLGDDKGWRQLKDADRALRTKHGAFLRRRHAYLAAVVHAAQKRAYAMGRTLLSRALLMSLLLLRPAAAAPVIARKIGLIALLGRLQ